MEIINRNFKINDNLKNEWKLEFGFYNLLVPVAKEHKYICTNISIHYTLYNDNNSGRFEVMGIRSQSAQA